MKAIHSLFILLFSVFSFGVAQAQCSGTLSLTGTDPSFTITSSNSSGPNTSYLWDLGDGSTSTTPQSVSHTYAINGIYWVTCYFTDSVNMCSDVDTIQVTVTNAVGQCDASFSITGNGPSYVFTPINTPSSPPGYYYFDWSFGDGSTSGSSSMNGVNHTYTANGTYTVTCILYDSVFCVDTATAIITVTNVSSPSCDASFSITGTDPSFTFTPINTPASPVGYYYFSWSFGDGSTSGSNSMNGVNHTYTANGTYTVTCILYDSVFCSDTVSIPVTVSGVSGSTCDASIGYIDSNGLVSFFPLSPIPGAT